jgi:D-galactarolactone isomerase
MTDGSPRLKTPPGACDTHIHFYDTADRYPVAPTALFLPPPARVADYRELQERLGLERVVVVQPSSYGTDNRCTLDAVAELGLAVARAVVVVDQSVEDGELQDLTDAGARGIRFHMMPGGALPWEILEDMGQVAKIFEGADEYIYESDWHGPIRFDIISVVLDGSVTVTHFEDAFH